VIASLAALVAVVALAGSGAGLAWWAAGGMRDPDSGTDPSAPARVAVLAYLVLYIAGSVILIVTAESSDAGPLLAAGGMAAFGVGAVVTRRAVGAASAMPPPRTEGFSPAGVLILTVVGLVAVGALIAQHGIPLIAADPLASREGFAGPVFDLFRWLVPPAALVAFALAVAGGRSRDRWLAVVGLTGVGGLEVLLASRALPFELAIGALLIASWAGRRLSWRAWGGLAAAGLVVFVGVQLIRGSPEGGFTGPADAVAFAARRTTDRVVLIHPRTLEVVATSIPAEEPYFGGSTYVRRIAALLGAEDRPPLGFWLYERLFPGETGGFAAPGVAGEAWANGGPVLAAALMAALGALAVWLGRVIARLPGGPADRAYAALVVVAVARTYATSLNGFLLTLVVSTAWWLVASGQLERFVARTIDRTEVDPPSAL
jgi:hypothetical protein